MIFFRWLTLVVVVGFVCTMGCSRAVNDENKPSGQSTKYVPGEMLVKFKPSFSSTQIDSLNRLHGVSIIKKLEELEVFRLKIPEERTVPQMVELYQKNPNVEYAEPNAVIRLSPIERKGEALEEKEHR